MKKNLKIIIYLLAALFILGVGLYMKLQTGYVFDTQQQVLDTIADIKKTSSNKITIVAWDKLECKNHSYCMVVGKYENDKFLYIFKQIRNTSRFEDYYETSINNSENECISIHADKDLLQFIFVDNTLQKIDLLRSSHHVIDDIPINNEQYIFKIIDSITVNFSPFDKNGEYLDDCMMQSISFS